MPQITTSLIKVLREKSGAGMLDCKNALVESAGDLEGAVDWLRKKGLARAARKADRAAVEGLVAVAAAGSHGAVVEVNAETDFVARNERFQQLVSGISKAALEGGGSVEVVAAAAFGDSTVADQITVAAAAIGENVVLRRSARLEVSRGAVATYTHAPVGPGLGKIGVVVALESMADRGKLEKVGKQIAMHIAAARPLFLSRSSIDDAAIAREREVLREQARASGKPEAIVDKMVEGRMQKYYQEVCLLEQAFVVDGETRISDVVDNLGRDVGAPVAVTGFERFALGEGLDKAEVDFAAEVAAAAGR